MKRAARTAGGAFFCVLAGVEPVFAGEGGMPQLDLSTFPGQIFWMGLTFGLLYLFFAARVLPDLSRIVEGRAAHVADDLAEAERQTAAAHRTKDLYEKALSQAHREAADHLESVECSIRETASGAMARFQERMSQDIAVAERRIAKAGTDATAEMDRLIADSVVLSAEKLAGIRVDRAQAQSVVDSLSPRSKAA